MTKERVVKELKELIKLCDDGLGKQTLKTDFTNKNEVEYLHGFKDAIWVHIENLNVLIKNINYYENQTKEEIEDENN